MYLIRSRGAMLALYVLVWSSVQAEIPSAHGECVAGKETTPSSHFTILEGGGVVRHETTGLEWRRCAEGMSWSGSGCEASGGTTSWNWYGALQHAQTQAGWRLPNVNELSSIVEECRTHPAINQQVFPNTPTSNFWSASPYAGLSDRALSVYFGSGNDDYWSKNSLYQVRLVRGGQ